MRELSQREENEHASESCRARTRENVGSETEYEYLRDSEYLPEVGIERRCLRDAVRANLTVWKISARVADLVRAERQEKKCWNRRVEKSITRFELDLRVVVAA